MQIHSFMPITSFSCDLTYSIFSFLDLKSLSIVQRVCKKWQEIVNRDDVWKQMAYHYFKYYPMIGHLTWKKYLQEQLDDRRFIEGHYTKFYVSIEGKIKKLLISGNYLISICSGSSYLRIFDLDSKKPLHIIQMKATNYCCFTESKGWIFIGCSNGWIRIFDISKGVELSASQVSSTCITNMQVYNQSIIVFSQDGFLRMWDIKTWTIAFEFFSPLVIDHILITMSHELMACSYKEGTIQVFDLRSKKLLCKKDFVHQIDRFIWRGSELIIVIKSKLFIWDIYSHHLKEYTIPYKSHAQVLIVSVVSGKNIGLAKSEYIVIGKNNGLIHVYDLQENKDVVHLNIEAHSAPIHKMIIKGSIVIASYMNPDIHQMETIKIWNIKTKKWIQTLMNDCCNFSTLKLKVFNHLIIGCYSTGIMLWDFKKRSYFKTTTVIEWDDLKPCYNSCQLF